jgi:hypothetical protein
VEGVTIKDVLGHIVAWERLPGNRWNLLGGWTFQCDDIPFTTRNAARLLTA